MAPWAVQASFRCGRRHGRCPFPPWLVTELSLHKRDCLGEAPERVALEMDLLFGVAEPLKAPRRAVALGSERQPAQPEDVGL